MFFLNEHLRKQIPFASFRLSGYPNLRKQILFLLLLISVGANAQPPKSYTSSEILQNIKKLNVLGSVLYIAAHPDDENTRLLGYLANEKMYRTGYLSLTRGDGGQNLIGDEQGIDLGLIRTQELLAARRIDGAEQFFTRAYDFGYSKSPEETFKTWGHDKILSDVVWVIRSFKPDVIITRFPTTGEGGHGHHTASGILAEEAFDAAADPTKFPEQLKYVTTWQAKRLLWNTFNFGGNNTQNESQFKIDVGAYNPLLGKSYGEIAALSRSQHKSQGFGVPSQRGTTLEYFKTIKGEAPVKDLFDGVDVGWVKTFGSMMPNVTAQNIKEQVDNISKAYSIEKPEKSIRDLVSLYSLVESEVKLEHWKNIKLAQIKNCIEQCAGLYMEASTTTPYAVQGDSLKLNFVVNNRRGDSVLSADVKVDEEYLIFDQLKKNENRIKTYTKFVSPNAKLTQPYWLVELMDKGSFNISDQTLIGNAENDPLSVDFSMMIEGKEFVFTKPIRYKYTDPVKGEIFQPVNVIPPYFVNSSPNIVIGIAEKPSKKINFEIQSNLKIQDSIRMLIPFNGGEYNLLSQLKEFQKNERLKKEVDFSIPQSIENQKPIVPIFLRSKLYKKDFSEVQKIISYEHIPLISYTYSSTTKFVFLNLKITGSHIGYIVGAGDKVPQALEQMGYKVTLLKESDITTNNLKQFDAIVTGVRAYNTNEWMNNVYDVLMQYVNDGGVVVAQYNTSNQLGPVKAKIAPYPFNIGRTRVTDEEAKVNFLQPNHPALNYPNKITEKDFEGWVQERSVYHAEKIDSNYKRILGFKDFGETQEQDGSLIIADYGKGKFVYTGLALFRQLPAGVPGAYRLFANLLATKQTPKIEKPKTKKQNLPLPKSKVVYKKKN
ncbi:MAG: PIG-L family deacetylase [Ferruginibacter sp.]|nr:PIG-L family deacetylase [Ferruginibacter sp.]